MKKELYIHIPKPCQEDWQQMTPVTNGRYCNSCTKQVVDFSTMSDVEVLNFLSRSTGKLCGRFSTDQLQRPLQPTKEEPRKSLWLAAFMPLLLLFDRSSAQRKAPVTPVVVQEPQKLLLPMGESLVGDTLVQETKPSQKSIPILISGSVIEDRKNPIAGATILLKGSHIGTMSDNKGVFKLSIPDGKEKDIKLLISMIGFQTKEIPITTQDAVSNYDEHGELIGKEIILAPVLSSLAPSFSGEVLVVVGYTKAKCKRVIKKTDTIPTLIRKAIGHAPFRVFPNPAKTGAAIQVDVQQKGSYSIQLFSGQSALVAAETVEATQGATIHSFALPASMAAGIYYIRVVNEQTKKQYTDKILVQ